MLQEDNRIIVTDSLQQKSFGIVGVGRHDYLESWNRTEQTVNDLRMLRGSTTPCANGHANDQRGFGASEHVAELGRLIEDLVEADADKVAKHDLGDRAIAG
ncbi:hypothetical protein D3C78_1621580 [compost metagenome]